MTNPTTLGVIKLAHTERTRKYICIFSFPHGAKAVTRPP